MLSCSLQTIVLTVKGNDTIRLVVHSVQWPETISHILQQYKLQGYSFKNGELNPKTATILQN